MNEGAGGNVKTRISKEIFVVNNATVIRFEFAPECSGNEVEIKEGRVLLLHSIISELKGKNTDGIRAEVTHLNQSTRKCKLKLNDCNFNVEVGYFGNVNEGIENC